MGLLKSSIESWILEEVKSMLNLFERSASTKKPISDDEMMFTGAVVNSLWAIVAGERNEWDGPVQPQILKKSEELFKAINRVTVTGLAFASGLRLVAPGFTGWTEIVKVVEEMKKLINVTVQKHFLNYDPDNLV